MKLIKQFFVFGLTFIIVMTLNEIFIRNSHLASVSSTDFYEDIGRGRRRNLDYVYFNEGFGIGRYNEFRYKGESYSPKKDTNSIRIALIGDSYIENAQVFERNYFASVCKKILSQEFKHRKIEFLNFGKTGYDIGNMYAYQKILVDNFKPDIVLYMLSKDDLSPKSKDLLRPTSIIQKDSLLVSLDFDQEEMEMFEKTKFFTQNFSILNMLNNGRKKTTYTPILSILLGKLYFWEENNSIDDQKTSSDLNDYKINPITQLIIQSLDPSIVIIVNRDKTKLPGIFENILSEKGLDYIDLSEVLNKMNKTGENPNYWSVTKKIGHWNNSAHKVVGKELAKQLKPILIEKKK